jgi:hypothetical protein
MSLINSDESSIFIFDYQKNFMKIFLVFLFLANTLPAFGQKESFQFDLFNVHLEINSVKAFNDDNELLFERNFYNPSPLMIDIDNDGVEEFLIQDSAVISGIAYFSLYAFNTIDTFYLADSIYSGRTPIYQTSSADVEGIIFISGYSSFDRFNSHGVYFFSPISCWYFSDDEFISVNNEVYDLFIIENNLVINFIEEYFNEFENDCDNARLILGAIASAYANYVNAGESAMAVQLLNNYYKCGDKEKLNAELNSLIN